jgi:hypothetical protein
MDEYLQRGEPDLPQMLADFRNVGVIAPEANIDVVPPLLVVPRISAS